MESATVVEAAPAVIEATTKPLNKECSDGMKVLNVESQNKESEEVESFDSSDSYDSEEEGTFNYPQPPPRPTTTVGSRTLFVGNLSFKVEKSDIEEFFKEAGEVVSVRFSIAPEDGCFRGFGFVEFASSEEAEKALEFNSRPLLGREVRLDLAGVNTPQSRSGGGGSSVDGDGNAPPTRSA